MSDTSQAPDASGAFDAAAPALWGVAYRVAYRSLGRRDDAEDVAQETLARASIRWETIDLATRDGWVARTAANLAIDQLRRQARRRRPQPGRAVDAPPADRHAAERAEVVAALRALPRRQQEVVALRYLADLSEQVVADTLGISLGTVKQHASRGLAALRTHTGFGDPALTGSDGDLLAVPDP